MPTPFQATSTSDAPDFWTSSVSPTAGGTLSPHPTGLQDPVRINLAILTGRPGFCQ